MHGTHCQCKVTLAHLLILLATAFFINGNQITPPSSYHHLLLLLLLFFFFFFFLGKLYHYLHTTTDRSLDPPSSFFLGKLYHHQSELRSTIFSILPDSTVGTIISVLDPLISKIKKQTFQFKQYPQTFQFKQSPKSLTHYTVFLSLFHFQIFHQWCRSSAFLWENEEKITEK